MGFDTRQRGRRSDMPECPQLRNGLGLSQSWFGVRDEESCSDLPHTSSLTEEAAAVGGFFRLQCRWLEAFEITSMPPERRLRINT